MGPITEWHRETEREKPTNAFRQKESDDGSKREREAPVET
jgi:hypothetical protein